MGTSSPTMLETMNSWNPDDVFGISIFVFFVVAIVTFFFISYRFMKHTGTPNKKGERMVMWASGVGVVFVLIYAVMAFVFKIII